DLLPNGSGFLRVSPPDPSEDDVYVSAAQVKRCELVPGDKISGPRRAPRRSERFASLVRIDTINGRPAEEPDAESAEDEERPAGRRRRGRRGGRGRGAKSEEDGATALQPEEERTAEPEAAEPEAPEPEGPEPEGLELEGLEEPVGPPLRGGRPAAEDVIVEGEVDLLPNGSGFLRVSPPDPSEDDVYVSAAQVKRCELVPGDKISGPRRAPRRSERFASLVRIDTINGRPAEEVVDSTRFDDLPAAFPTERFKLGSDDPTIKAVEWLTPFGQGSRVTIVGPARAGKTEALRRLAAGLAEHQDVQVFLVLAGVRPEEISEWQEGPVAPVAAVSFAASADAQAHTLERAVDQGRRLAARGAHVVVLADTLSGIPLHPARKLMASAKNIAGGGSLTVIATASESLGGETTVIALDPLLASTGRLPAVDLLASWTLRPELLVGQAGAEAIARARMEAVDR
ncbi:MAG: hypothetical protein JO304_23315, partial [Solirubrobacterales bacterium]|nr:hypothetical protein [Solirubrobacterales bacterium]